MASPIDIDLVQRQPSPSLQSRSPDGHNTPPTSESSGEIKPTPFPTKQILVLALCRLSEPVAMTSSFPYLFFMIRDFNMTDDEKEIGRYAGLLASSFSLAQFFSGMSPTFVLVDIQQPYLGDDCPIGSEGSPSSSPAYSELSQPLSLLDFHLHSLKLLWRA